MGSILLSASRHVVRTFTDLTTCIAYWIAFGPHGPRALDPPGEGKNLFFHTTLILAGCLAIFVAIRAFGGQPPESMTKEWQEASNELLKVRLRSSVILRAFLFHILVPTLLPNFRDMLT